MAHQIERRGADGTMESIEAAVTGVTVLRKWGRVTAVPVMPGGGYRTFLVVISGTPRWRWGPSISLAQAFAVSAKTGVEAVNRIEVRLVSSMSQLARGLSAVQCACGVTVPHDRAAVFGCTAEGR